MLNLCRILHWFAKPLRSMEIEDRFGRRHGSPHEFPQARTIWFYRKFWRLSGGFLKHSHYFEHVHRMPGFVPKITFGMEPANELQNQQRQRLWPAGESGIVPRWKPKCRDVLFLNQADWSYVDQLELRSLDIPRINIIQGFGHVDKSRKTYQYLARKAIRICVSEEVADAICATGQPTGPVLTIPNGTDVRPFGSTGDALPIGYETRRQPITVIGYKSPELAGAFSRQLNSACIEHLLISQFIDRDAFLSLLDDSRIVVCLPREREGFYLPALEAMASGCLVVTVDSVGNRGFCLHEENCLIANRDSEALFRMTKRALTMSGGELGRFHQRAKATAAQHSLETERQKFHVILNNIDRLWAADEAELSSLRSVMPSLRMPI